MRKNISCCADRVTVKRTFHTNMDIVTDKQENISCESVTYEKKHFMLCRQSNNNISFEHGHCNR